MLNYQTKLIDSINSLHKLPHSILLYGEFGAGHDEVCKYISDKFNIPICNIEISVDISLVNDILSTLTPTIYVFTMNNLSIREQNVLLKLFEEPSIYSYIILKATSSDFVLETIKNRSYLLKFENYKRNQLEEFLPFGILDTEEKIILDICNTPGLIEIANHTNIKELFNLCCNIVQKLKGANFQNTLSISEKINYKDLYDKYDLHLFIKMLKYVILNADLDDKISIYKIVKNGFDRIDSLNNKQNTVENVLIQLWYYFNN